MLNSHVMQYIRIYQDDAKFTRGPKSNNSTNWGRFTGFCYSSRKLLEQCYILSIRLSLKINQIMCDTLLQTSEILLWICLALLEQRSLLRPQYLLKLNWNADHDYGVTTMIHYHMTTHIYISITHHLFHLLGESWWKIMRIFFSNLGSGCIFPRRDF